MSQSLPPSSAVRQPSNGQPQADSADIFSGLLVTTVSAGVLAAVDPLFTSESYVGSTNGRFASIVHAISNAQIVVPTDWFMQAMVDLTPSGAVSNYYYLMLYILTLGGFFFGCVACNATPLVAAVRASALTAALHFAWDKDIVAVSTMCWLPWMCLFEYCALRSSAKNSSRIAFAALLATACLTGLSAHFLAIVPACFALVYGIVFCSATGARALLAAVILLFPAVLAASTGVPAPVPDYPKMSHVVRDDGMIGLIQPLLGRDMPIQLIDRDNVKAFYGPVALALLIVSLLALLRSARLARTSRPPTSSVDPGALCSLVVALLALGDTLPREPLAQIMPIAVLGRVIPGLLYFPLVALMLACGACCLALLSHPNGRRSIFPALAVVPLAFLVARPTSPGITPAGPQGLQQSAVDSVGAPQLLEKVLSPSYFAIAREGAHLLTGRARYQAAAKISGQSIGCVANGSSSKDAASAVDGNYETRWTSSSLGQHGSEWIQISCPQNASAIGIELSAGRWSTDFPRGLRISTGPTCNGPLAVRYQNDSWQGVVHFTPAGYPHYRDQGHVKVFFPEAQPVGCIRAEQIGFDTLFDWSVAEISVYADGAQADAPADDTNNGDSDAD